MPSVCCYFQVHQPYRLKPYRAHQVGREHEYFDEPQNAAILRKVANKCYLPANRKMLELIHRHPGQFKIAFALSGTVIEQLAAYAPEALESFQELFATGAVEAIAETSHHSLAALYDPTEFAEQVSVHTALLDHTFGVRPQVFRNTELIYDDQVAKQVQQLGFKAMLAEGADDVLGWRSPNFVYDSVAPGLKLLLKNYRLSDDIAFRFSNRGWHEFPLTADKFVDWLSHIDGSGDVVGLFMDYETFGEHQWEETGIFHFLDAFPGRLLARRQWSFVTPSEAIARYPAVSELSFPRTVSWADLERDLSAWKGNSMQQRALDRVYRLAQAVRKLGDPKVSRTWQRLQTSDHFYYMCTKWFSDGDVHAYFSPYESPYEAFINAMNVLDDFESFVLGLPGDRLPIAS